MRVCATMYLNFSTDRNEHLHRDLVAFIFFTISNTESSTFSLKMYSPLCAIVINTTTANNSRTQSIATVESQDWRKSSALFSVIGVIYLAIHFIILFRYKCCMLLVNGCKSYVRVWDCLYTYECVCVRLCENVYNHTRLVAVGRVYKWIGSIASSTTWPAKQTHNKKNKNGFR